ncbi:MAG: response regulator [Ilumatobacteraceae bacterium]|nr:response regulator [Ilumatobacteraceae bacterium]MBP7887523.1 response regulator [Ilumatobacteraceae bacterium]MBP8208779.1 response regulator [Ilumatobacteraceae bacterium]MBP9051656.1 response regulator [Ilumatobacteraceae bacterium]
MTEATDAALAPTPRATISVFLADDNVIVREGVRALLARANDITVVGVADDLDSLISGAVLHTPHVVVSDIRMPPNFQSEGIEGCKEIRKRLPGTGVVILSQFDDPDYAIALLSGGAAGYAYLLKDRIAEGDQLLAAIRSVATGGSMLDPSIVDAMVRPAVRNSGLDPDEERLLEMLAAGRTLKAIALTRQTTAAAVSADVEKLFSRLADSASAGTQGALRRLRMLHEAIVSREEQGESLSRLLPGGVAEQLIAGGKALGESERLDVTVVMSDIRGYTTIAEHADPSSLVRQLNRHRAEMNRAILGCGGTVMQYIGDAVMAVFGAPQASRDHADRALDAALAMHLGQRAVNLEWEAAGLPVFDLGIGLSTGDVAAAFLGSEERAEYTVIGDAVNLCQRLQQFASHGQIVLSEATWAGLTTPPSGAERLPASLVKGRETLVEPYRITVPAA